MGKSRAVFTRRKLAIAAVTALSVIALVWRFGPTARLSYLEQQLLFGSDVAAGDAATQLIETEAGLKILVAALCSADESISQRAGKAMLGGIDNLALLAEEIAAPKLDRIAQALAEDAAGFSPAGREMAYQIALRLLTWPTAGRVDGDHPRLVDAREIVRAISQSSSVDSLRDSGDSAAERLITHVPIRSKTFSEATSGISEQNPADIDLPDLPGGALPLGSIDLKRAEADRTALAATENAAAVREGDGLPVTSPRTLLTPADARPILGPSISGPDAAGSLTLLEAAEEPKAQLYEPPAVMPAALRSAVSDLRSGDLASAATVRARLEKLGLSPVEIAVAEQFASADVKVRRRLAESLAGLPGIDCKPWLIWLSHDMDAEVRLAALTVMATSGETEMLARVAELARVDSDPQVQQQAAKVVSKARR